jgi:multicomponent Na+:H+ antiporter subunit A
MTLVLLSPIALGALVGFVGRGRLGRWGAAAFGIPLAIAAVLLATRVPEVLDGRYRTETYRWIDGLDLGFTFRTDGYGVLLGLIVCIIGVAIAIYSAAYFHHGSDLARIAGPITAFAGAMLGLVLADDVLTLFIFWELTSVTSFLLIGFDDEDPAAIAAARKALLVTGAGGLALLGGLVILAVETGTTRLSEMIAAGPTGALVNVALVLVLIGAFSKSAQVPLHFWLPGAMKAPTPISAYLHSATMVKAGIVLIARMSPGFADIGPWRPMIVIVGGVTMLVGGARALRQFDVKLLLAHGTVSQLGLLVILAGFGTSATTFTAVAMLATHALFKAPLFMVVGAVDHATGTRDLRHLGGLRHQLPVLAVIGGLAAASMAAVPPLLGFASKEKALDALVTAEPVGWAVAATVLVTIGSILTVAYTIRWWWGIFGDWAPVTRESTPHHHAPELGLVAPAAVFAGLGLAFGVASAWFGDRLAELAASLDPKATEKYLTLWAGFNTALVLSGVAVAGGIVVARFGPRLDAWQPPPLPSGDRIYDATYNGLMRLAKQVTRIVQNGSLPAYVGVVFLTLSALLVTALLRGGGGGDVEVVWADSWLQVVLALLVAVLAIGVALAPRRFTAALLLGGAGTFQALIFLFWGAPDLALTQVLVETLALVVLLLVLRHLPERFSAEASWAPRGARVAIAATVGVLVTAFAWAAGTTRVGEPPNDVFNEFAVPEAGGRNIVNVILVDFRAADTLGEIAVLGIAAVGVANLVRAARRHRRPVVPTDQLVSNEETR